MTLFHSIDVMLCTNDDHGNRTPYVRAIDVRLSAGAEYSLEGPLDDGESWSLEDGLLTLAGERFPVLSEQDWVGNWCWRNVHLLESDHDRLFKALAATGCWTMTMATDDWMERWDTASAVPGQRVGE